MTDQSAFGLLIALALLSSSCSGPGGLPDGSVDAAVPDGSAEPDAGFDGGSALDAGFDAGNPQECDPCAPGTNDCGLTMSCREVGQSLGYCARFQPGCDGGGPDLASVQLSYTTVCRLNECTVDVSFNVLSSDQMRVRVLSLSADGGPFVALDTESPAPLAAASWKEQAAGCLPASSALQGADCLTHQYQVRLDLRTSRGSSHALLFSTGSSQLPSVGMTQSAFLTIAASRAVVTDAGLLPP